MVKVNLKRPYVTICGPLASGKTTIAKILAAHFGWSLLLEDLEANPYLRDYYTNMKRWGFHTVTAFMVRALQLQEEIVARLTHEPVCQDWHFAEHYDIYGVHVFEEGIIDERERKTCEELHRYLITHATTPDLVIVLTAAPSTLLARIKTRQRIGEREIPSTYVEHLVSRYARWTTTIPTPHFIIDTGKEDIVHDPVAAVGLIARIEKAMG